ncbi:hypothetical protein AMJ47_00555 [Parcubacteria bacterium DG_72]|nr:MAG: hypothetical protein AMJ47_00555 [Parcubacteria bacterium DG_72]
MKIFICANIQEVPVKEKWFSKKVCKDLKRKKIEFGFEIKGPIDGCDKISYPFGIHLPGSFANRWQKEGEIIKGDLLRMLEPVSYLHYQPLYVVLHGLRVNKDNAKTEGFISDASAEDYLLAFKRIVKLVEEMLNLRVPAAVENVAITNFAKQGDLWLPRTYLDLRTPTLVSDMLMIKKETGCQLVLDIGHLGFTANLAKRELNYETLKKEIPNRLSRKELEVYLKHKIFLRKGRIPVFHRFRILKEVQKPDLNIFHVAGCSADGKFREIKNLGREKVVSSHDAIEDNDFFRMLIKTILKKKDVIIVVEVSEPDSSLCYKYRPAGVEERSFETLCHIINEELSARE